MSITSARSLVSDAGSQIFKNRLDRIIKKSVSSQSSDDPFFKEILTLISSLSMICSELGIEETSHGYFAIIVFFFKYSRKIPIIGICSLIFLNKKSLENSNAILSKSQACKATAKLSKFARRARGLSRNLNLSLIYYICVLFWNKNWAQSAIHLLHITADCA